MVNCAYGTLRGEVVGVFALGMHLMYFSVASGGSLRGS